AAETIVAADGVLYALRQKGNPPTERELVAVTLADGKERWAVSSAKFGPEADFQLNTAGAGYVVVVRRAKNQLLVFSPKDGSVLWKLPSGASPWTPVVDGALWVGGQKYDPRTGAVKGRLARGIGNQGCTPSTLVNNILTQSRGCGYVELPPENDPEQGKVKSLKYGGARGGCMQGMAPANGMFYTCQNNCRCAPGHVYGFLGLAPSGAWPTAEDFGKARPVEKGPAFGAVDAISVGVADWPLFLGDAERSSGARTQLPAGLKQVWIAKVASAGEGMLGTAWRSRLESPLSAPVAAYGKVFAAKTDAGQVAAFDAATGKPAWTYSAGARIDTPPTLHRGLCIFGAHDGWVYALRAKDGALVWRTRVAPWERRMVAYGQVESVWPAIGTVLVHEGVLYANAGRTSESDGGIAVVALDPASGKMLWGSAIAPGPGRQTDLLRVVDGKVQWHHVPLDPKTGAVDRSTKPSKGASQGGLMDGTWTILGKRRAGRAFTKGKVQDDLLAWNADLILTPRQAIPQATPTADPTGLAEPKPKAKGWAVGLPGGSKVDALAIAQNATASAGRAAAGSFLRVNAAADGKKLAEFSLPAAPTFAGIAIAEGRIFVTLQDGSLLCFGK
ncbi:PQQ-binding-like beta-propeller repeat protein, partial [bacterium]|nr:PQQ-binding-like beta-propeller repeat protein [bacterium]